jgi:broad specificity phosphatase PhoE
MNPASDLRTRLLLLRHGQAAWRHGPGGEPALSEAGRADVELAAAALPRFDHLVASPGAPARQTAELIALVRGPSPSWYDDLDEVRAAMPPVDAASYDAWLDRLFEATTDAGGGESLADAGARVAAVLRRIGDRFLARTILVVSHPVVLLAFRSREMHAPLARGHVDAMPDLAMATVDYLQGRFYIVTDFPVRWTITGAAGR